MASPPPPPPAGPAGEGLPPKPGNNLVWAVLTTIFCCLPAGIVSIIFAAKVDGLYNSGQYVAAVDAASKSRTWAIIAVVLGILAGLSWGGYSVVAN